MVIIDTHQHLWDQELFSFSWCKNHSRLNRNFHMADYLEATRGFGLKKSVHVEADVDEPYMLDETRYILALANQDTPIEGVVACGRPEHENFLHYIDQIAGHPKLKGIRRILHTQPDDLGTRPVFVDHVRRLSEYDLSFDICVLARQLPVAINLVDKCPKVSFILDHCGVPLVKEKILHPWREHIKEIAGFPNIVCKVSGLVAYAHLDDWTPEDLQPYIDHVIECFGWDRVMFGSDWPVCTLAASFEQWVKALDFATRAASATERHKLFHDNAARVYRLS